MDREDNWETDLGAWFAGERVVLRGKDLFTELYNESWISVWHYAITGRFFPEKGLEFWSRIWVLCTSYPEPRIWNNRIAALSGSSKSTAFLAMAGANSVSDAKFFGGHAQYAATEFIIRAKKLVDDGETIEEIVKNEIKKIRTFPPGYGRPIIKSDERIPPAIRLAKDLGLFDGPHVKLAFQIDKLLVKNRYRVQINIGGLAAAFAADQGLSPYEWYCVATVMYSAGMIACYMDSASKPAGTFFPLRCGRIDYKGKPRRKWEI